MNVKGKHVLVIGSENPWIEALILEAGADRVTTLGKTEWMLYRVCQGLWQSQSKKK